MAKPDTGKKVASESLLAHAADFVRDNLTLEQVEHLLNHPREHSCRLKSAYDLKQCRNRPIIFHDWKRFYESALDASVDFSMIRFPEEHDRLYTYDDVVCVSPGITIAEIVSALKKFGVKTSGLLREYELGNCRELGRPSTNYAISFSPEIIEQVSQDDFCSDAEKFRESFITTREYLLQVLFKLWMNSGDGTQSGAFGGLLKKDQRVHMLGNECDKLHSTPWVPSLCGEVIRTSDGQLLKRISLELSSLENRYFYTHRVKFLKSLRVLPS